MNQLPFQFFTSGFTFQDLDWDHLPFNDGVMYSPRGGLLKHNDEGIRATKVRGKYYDQPVGQSVIIKTRLDVYQITEDRKYLDVAIDHAEHLIAGAIYSREGAYLPYPFEWPMHGFADATLPSPWFSGMAQGHALSAFSRLYEITGNERYLDFAHDIFQTFLNLESETEPWTVTLLDGKYLWFEEGPRNDGRSDVTFNGHIFGIYGLYDYWRVTKDSRAESLADGAMTSVLAHMDGWRVPGGMSFYCLSHRQQYFQYHGVHIEQLGVLYDLTAHPIWATLQDRFIDDYPLFTRPVLFTDVFVIKPGTYTVGGHGDLTVTKRVEITVEEELRLDCNLRGRLAGETGIYCRTRQEEIGTWQVPEIPDRTYVEGIKERLQWAHPRKMRTTSDSIRLATFDEQGTVISDDWTDLPEGSVLVVNERALIRSQPWLKIHEGSHAGKWTPFATCEPVDVS